MMKIEAETEIAAPAHAVWTALADLSSFPAWNPFIRNARGSTELGKHVHVRVRPSFGIPLGFRARIAWSEPDRCLRWIGHVVAPWLGRGDHLFEIEKLPNGHVRFSQREVFEGLLPRLFAKPLAREVKRGFEAMNAALKARVEAQERVS
jgi:hypothetical protein